MFQPTKLKKDEVAGDGEISQQLLQLKYQLPKVLYLTINKLLEIITKSCFHFSYALMGNLSAMNLSLSICFHTLILCFFLETGKAGDMINRNETLTDGKTLVSPSQRFVLGFFTPVDSTGANRYLGIWYKNSPDIVVWVANREFPITGLDGVLVLRMDGNLVLLNGTKQIVWSANSSSSGEGLVAQLLNSGNFVIRSGNNMDRQSYIWQSFDFISDTLLPGMKLGWNLTSGHNSYMRSWKNKSDPSPGEFTFRIDINELPQFVFRKGLSKIYRSGAWNGLQFSGTNLLANPNLKPTFVYGNELVYYFYEWADDSILPRLVVNESGMTEFYLQNEGTSEWSQVYTLIDDLCDDYGKCGPNGICRISKSPICDCLEGFVPKSQREWDVLKWDGGCIREIPLNCSNGEGFVRLRNVNIPDLLEFQLNRSMTLKECENECLKKCNCTAYANSDVRSGGSGCLMWFGNLVDLREFVSDDQQDIYFRVPASELDLTGNTKKKRLLLTVFASLSAGILLSLGTWYMFQQWRKKKKKNGVRGLETGKEDLELPVFQLDAVVAATSYFSSSNRIGEGGFGPVYMGQLPNGQEIAVKRLSKDSGQGLEEFKNEVILISKLQHRNLVRLLGCCLDGEERMLIYEYMPNRSLDYFIFDQQRSRLLSWKIRFDIAMGIARGILYLHQDSRLRIIHRDLKASNILLDCELKPKISDFGIAKSIGVDQVEGKTKRVIGTYGYMSPEYAFNGKYSVKSDVFSLGVLLLELVSGRKNKILDISDQHLSLLGQAWLFWKEGKALQLVDECLKETLDASEILRCIHVGLLCVQKLPDDRPIMATVVVMMSNEEGQLPEPKHPGYFMESTSPELFKSNKERREYENTTTMTMPEAR